MERDLELQVLPSDDDEIVIEAVFDEFDAAELFDHFTTPDLVTRWWPEEAVIDPRFSGTYLFKWLSKGWTLSGQYKEFERGSTLSFTWKWEHEDLPARTVELEFSDRNGGGSSLRLTHRPYGDSPREKQLRAGDTDAWKHSLSCLARLR